ncbi:MAG: methyltransferase family protein [Promethearchaeota archaeon]
MNDKNNKSETSNSVENLNNSPNLELDRASDRKIKWIKFWIGTMKYIMILPITVGVIAPMIFYLAPIAFAGIYIVLQLTGGAFLVELNINSISWQLMVLGMIILLVGFLFTVGGLGQIILFRLRKKTTLVQSHFYKHIRHPQSVGIILCVLGMVIMVFSYTDIVGVLALFWVFYFFLRIEAYIEEYFLIQKYKDDYITYVQNTGFFFPRIRKTQVSQNGWTANQQKHLLKKIFWNLLSLILVLSVIFIGCHLYIHFTNESLPILYDTWRKPGFYPDNYIIFESIAVSPIFIFWVYFFVVFLLKYRKKEESNE